VILSFIDAYLLPASLWFIMLAMGLSLKVEDILRVFKHRRAFVIGAISMLLIPPLVGSALAIFFAPTAALTVGFILLATCPGGMLSNLLTDYAKGDLALSLSLSIFISLLYILLVPIYAHFSLSYFMGMEQEIHVPFSLFVWKIFSITLVPTSLGMIIRGFFERLAIFVKPYIKHIATLVLVVSFCVIMIDQIPVLKLYIADLLGLVLALNLITVSLAWAGGKLFRLKPEERIAVGIEHIMRQEATAIFIAVTLIGSREMSLPMIVNTPVALVISVGVAFFARKYQLKIMKSKSA